MSSPELDPLVDQLPSRYVVGIDLGTTNSAVAYVDTRQQPWSVRELSIPQLVAPGEIESRETLPSFYYQPAAGQVDADTLRLPWQNESPHEAVGVYAREEGAKTSGRTIASAKSWLCHSGVDRTAELLPWHAAEDIRRLSPVEVSSRYLSHIRNAWNASFRSEPLEDQDIVLTLPASFDEVARELTVKAASHAGLPRVVLIEEPQAAFYAWVYKHQDDWHQRVTPGQKILICDIGGGTTDFTLIRVRRSESTGTASDTGEEDDSDERVQFHRVAVGDHLMLGGDNLDLTLARHLEQKLSSSGQLTSQQWDVLLGSCRRVKEELLGDNPPSQQTVHLPGGGAKLIGGGLQIEVSHAEVTELLVDGFLPKLGVDAKPLTHQSGFQEFGLPYAADPAITRHLAAFLSAHADVANDDSECDSASQAVRPDVVLFNGGFFASPSLRGRLLDVLRGWFADASNLDWAPIVLDNDRLDLAVARGAAYYGMVRRGDGVRIVASLARSYYVCVDDKEPIAVCVIPGSAEAGQDVRTDREFRLAISEPVEFPLLVSSVRLADRPGDLLPVDREQMTPLPPIRTVLKARRRSERGEVSVNLHARLTEIGTIDLWCNEVDSDRRWRLQFDVRSATQTDLMAHDARGETEGFVDESTWDDCRRVLAGVFAPEGQEKPAGLVKGLAVALEIERSQWPMPLMRRMWEALIELQEGRRRSAAHEARWLNLVGYTLRPGYGLAVDDWRVTETWRQVRGKLVHRGPTIQNESAILWRRIAGGLSAGQQQAIAESLLTAVRGIHRQSSTGKKTSAGVSLRPEELTEVVRLLGSLELLSVPVKVQLGDMLVDLISRRKFAAVREPMVWTLGRLGQRVPVYGPLNTVVSRQRAAVWLEEIMKTRAADSADHLAAMQIARRTDDRYRDLDSSVRTTVADWLVDGGAPQHMTSLVVDGGRLDQEEQGRVFGEKLPMGLRIE